MTDSYVLDDSKKLFFYEVFAYRALFPRYGSHPPYMDQFSYTLKVNIEKF